MGDKNNKLRAMLFTNDNGPALGLNDDNGKPRVIIRVTADGPAVRLFDEKKRIAAGLM